MFVMFVVIFIILSMLQSHMGPGDGRKLHGLCLGQIGQSFIVGEEGVGEDDGESIDGESVDGESVDGESVDGESVGEVDGESVGEDDGESVDGDDEDDGDDKDDGERVCEDSKFVLL